MIPVAVVAVAGVSRADSKRQQLKELDQDVCFVRQLLPLRGGKDSGFGQSSDLVQKRLCLVDCGNLRVARLRFVILTQQGADAADRVTDLR